MAIMTTDKLKNVSLTKEQEVYASGWLDSKVSELVRQLTIIDISELIILMAYEMQHRRREYVMRKLHTRLTKARKDKEWKDYKKWLS